MRQLATTLKAEVPTKSRASKSGQVLHVPEVDVPLVNSSTQNSHTSDGLPGMTDRVQPLFAGIEVEIAQLVQGSNPHVGWNPDGAFEIDPWLNASSPHLVTIYYRFK